MSACKPQRENRFEHVAFAKMKHSNISARARTPIYQHYLRPRPLPRPLPLAEPAVAEGFGTTDFFGASSTSNASKLRLSGSSQDLIVEPRTESVEKETGFFPRLQTTVKTDILGQAVSFLCIHIFHESSVVSQHSKHLIQAVKPSRYKYRKTTPNPNEAMKLTLSPWLFLNDNSWSHPRQRLCLERRSRSSARW